MKRDLKQKSITLPYTQEVAEIHQKIKMIAVKESKAVYELILTALKDFISKYESQKTIF